MRPVVVVGEPYPLLEDPVRLFHNPVVVEAVAEDEIGDDIVERVVGELQRLFITLNSRLPRRLLPAFFIAMLNQPGSMSTPTNAPFGPSNWRAVKARPPVPEPMSRTLAPGRKDASFNSSSYSVWKYGTQQFSQAFPYRSCFSRSTL